MKEYGRKCLISTMPECWSLERNKPNFSKWHFHMVNPSVLDKIQFRAIWIARKRGVIKKCFLLKIVNLITNDETVHLYALVCMEFMWQCFLGGSGGHSGAFCELLRAGPAVMVVAPLGSCQPTMHRKNNCRGMVGRVKCLHANVLRRQHSEDKPVTDLF